jgi:quercetin dioxygenase-like cupin family protein
MHRSPEPVDINRRALLRLGLAGASALVLGSGHRVGAGETTGIERKVLKDVDSTIPGYAKIHVRDIIFQPGATIPEGTMRNAIICECTEGALEVTNDGRTCTANTGDMWTCRRGGTEGAVNKRSGIAIMHVIDLLPAWPHAREPHRWVESTRRRIAMPALSVRRGSLNDVECSGRGYCWGSSPSCARMHRRHSRGPDAVDERLSVDAVGSR